MLVIILKININIIRSMNCLSFVNTWIHPQFRWLGTCCSLFYSFLVFFFVLWLVCAIQSVAQDCPCLIAPSVFSNGYQTCTKLFTKRIHKQYIININRKHNVQFLCCYYKQYADVDYMIMSPEYFGWRETAKCLPLRWSQNEIMSFLI